VRVVDADHPVRAGNRCIRVTVDKLVEITISTIEQNSRSPEWYALAALTSLIVAGSTRDCTLTLPNWTRTSSRSQNSADRRRPDARSYGCVRTGRAISRQIRSSSAVSGALSGLCPSGEV
jgi:hypothetical protein